MAVGEEAFSQTPREPRMKEKDPGVTAGWVASRCSSEGKGTIDNKDGRQNSTAPPNFKEAMRTVVLTRSNRLELFLLGKFLQTKTLFNQSIRGMSLGWQ